MYEYDVLDVPGLPTDPQEVNTMAKETLLGYVCLPGATVMVANVIREYSFVEVAQDGTGTHECVGHFVQSFAGADGQQNMTVFDSSTATTSSSASFLYSFRHLCIELSARTNRQTYTHSFLPRSLKKTRRKGVINRIRYRSPTCLLSNIRRPVHHEHSIFLQESESADWHL